MLTTPNVCFPFQSWARNEAVARNKLESEGVELKYGHFYSKGSNPKFQKKVGESPITKFRKEVGEVPINE